MEKEVYLKIKGRVQGIGFRWWAVKTAEEIGGIPHRRQINAGKSD